MLGCGSLDSCFIIVTFQSANVVTTTDNVGITVEVRAPLGEPPVFYRECDDMGRFVSDLKQKAIIRPEKKVQKSRWWPHFRKA